MPNFCVKSVKIYTGQKFFYTGIPVAPVTNIRYVNNKVNINRKVNINNTVIINNKINININTT